MKPKIILLSAAATIFFFVFLFAVYPLLPTSKRTPANTTLLGRNYSHLTYDQIVQKVPQDFQLPNRLTLTHQDRDYNLDPQSFSAVIDSHTTAESLISRNPVRSLSAYLASLLNKTDYPLQISYDSLALDTQIASVSAQVEKPFIPTELNLGKSPDGKDIVVVTPGQTGIMLNRNQTRNLIFTALSFGDFQSKITIPISTQGVLPSDDQVSQVSAQATKLIGKSLDLRLNGKSNPIDDKTLISWLDFNNSFKSDKLSEYLNSLSQSAKADPVDAVFKFENGKVLEFQPAKKGYRLDTDTTLLELPLKINQLTDSPEKLIAYDLPLIYTDPQIDTASVNNLGIKELLGKGTSSFKHSSSIRNMNVEKGASVVNRILVAPGETFSFIKALGEVSVESGYKMAYVIREGRTELDVGGGICQVSTTFFRAILDAGLDITYRQNHAYRVSYYEEDTKPGFDATVFIPNPDLKFINDTGHHLLIQNIYDGKNKTLTYEIYGTSDGRKAEITNYRQWGAAPPPPDRYIDDPTLPAGKIIQLEQRIPGLKTSFDWVVTRNGEVIHQKTFTSNYAPWAAVYRRGTGQ